MMVFGSWQPMLVFSDCCWAARRRRLCAQFVAAAILVLASSPSVFAAPRVVIADGEGTLVILEAATGREMARVRTRFTIDRVLTSPDGARVVVFDRDRGLVATLAADSLATLGTVTAGQCDLPQLSLVKPPTLFARDGQELLVTCWDSPSPNQRSVVAKKALLRLDLMTGRLTQWLDMEGLGDLVELPDDEIALVVSTSQSEGAVWLLKRAETSTPTKIPLSSTPRGSFVSPDKRFLLVNEGSMANTPLRPAEIRRLHFIDLANRRASAVVELAAGISNLRQSPNAEHIYYLDPSRGVVHAVSVREQRVVRTVDLGGPSDFVPQISAATVIRTRAPSNPVAQLRVLQGSEVIGPLSVSAPRVFLVSPDPNRVVVVGATEIYDIQLPNLAVSRQVSFPQSLAVGAAWAVADWREGRVAVLNVATASVILADLEAGRVLNVLSTGRESVGQKIGRITNETLAAAVDLATSRSSASALLAAVPDQPFAFTVNPLSETLTAVRFQDGTVAKAVTQKGSGVCFCLNPYTLVVFVSDGLSIVDPVTLVERTRHKLGRPGRFGYPTNADRSRTVLPGRGRVHLIDGNGATVATVTGIAGPPIVAFLP